MGDGQPQEATVETNPRNWVEEHGDFLHRYALLRLERPETAEDLVQETFLAALRGREQFQGASSERTWLVGILKHKVIDHFRRKRREQPVSDLGADEWVDELFDQSGHWKKAPRSWANPEAAVESAEFWNVFADCLGKLPGRLAEAFSLREIDGLESAEVCALLAVSPANLSVMLHRARLRLWRCLGTHWFATEEKRP
jgi:RNA polymerase sigma-70 factor (ECF subfamily)